MRTSESVKATTGQATVLFSILKENGFHISFKEARSIAGKILRGEANPHRRDLKLDIGVIQFFESDNGLPDIRLKTNDDRFIDIEL